MPGTGGIRWRVRRQQMGLWVSAVMEVVLLESRISHTYLEQPKDVDFYADVFNYLRAAALGELESQALIRDIAREVAA